jgi:hypothetical protein
VTTDKKSTLKDHEAHTAMNITFMEKLEYGTPWTTKPNERKTASRLCHNGGKACSGNDDRDPTRLPNGKANLYQYRAGKIGTRIGRQTF